MILFIYFSFPYLSFNKLLRFFCRMELYGISIFANNNSSLCCFFYPMIFARPKEKEKVSSSWQTTHKILLWKISEISEHKSSHSNSAISNVVSRDFADCIVSTNKNTHTHTHIIAVQLNSYENSLYRNTFPEVLIAQNLFPLSSPHFEVPFVSVQHHIILVRYK